MPRPPARPAVLVLSAAAYAGHLFEVTRAARSGGLGLLWLTGPVAVALPTIALVLYVRAWGRDSDSRAAPAPPRHKRSDRR